MKKHVFLTEASGGLTSNYLIDSIKEIGCKVIGSDIKSCAAELVCDDFIIFPNSNDKRLWPIIDKELERHEINVVIPSLDETLLEWSKRKDFYKSKGIHIIISPHETITICQDKWKTFKFFKDNGIPTPDSSLKNEYELLKPRNGRGSKGIKKRNEYGKNKSLPQNYISQKFIEGIEYTVDVFCDINNTPIYIIPRERLEIINGKSVVSITKKINECENHIKLICKRLNFIGPINIQFIKTKEGEIFFIEINPRIAGGMALGYRASENWTKLIVSNIINKKCISPKKVNYNLKMYRIYSDHFVNGK